MLSRPALEPLDLSLLDLSTGPSPRCICGKLVWHRVWHRGELCWHRGELLRPGFEERFEFVGRIKVTAQKRDNVKGWGSHMQLCSLLSIAFWRTRLPHSPFPCHTHGLAAKCTQRLFGAISASAMTALVRLSFAGGRSGACRQGGACCLPLGLSRSLVRAWRANANCFRFASFFS